MPKYQFDKIIEKYKGNYKAQEFSCWEQYVCMVFAQLTHRESLRDIESCLEAFGSKLYHCGIKSKVAKSTLAYWNEKTKWNIYCEYAQYLIAYARKLYKGNNEFLLELDATVYAFDSTTIDLCLNLFPWAKFRKKKGAIKYALTRRSVHFSCSPFPVITNHRYLGSMRFYFRIVFITKNIVL